MKPLEEMTDEQLAALWEVEHCLHPGTPPEANVGNEMARRLFQHPAQRIADLTGGVVTKDQDGRWLIWSIGVDPVATDKRWICDRWQDWSVKMNLPDDNRPWQESIYRPQVNVKNGGTNDE